MEGCTGISMAVDDVYEEFLEAIHIRVWVRIQSIDFKVSFFLSYRTTYYDFSLMKSFAQES